MSIKYINWNKEAEKIILTYEAFDEFKQSLDENKRYYNCDGFKTIRSYWTNGEWTLNEDYGDSTIWMGCWDETKGDYEYKIYTTAEEQLTKEAKSGMKCRRELGKMLENKYGKKFTSCFGSLKVDKDLKFKSIDNFSLVQALHNINRCNGPLIGINYNVEEKVWDNVYKADVKSAYPAAAASKIPDIRTGEIIYGYFEPTIEWPVVFYLKSYHIAEYGMYDTHTDCLSGLWKFRNMKKAPNRTKFKNEPYIEFRDIRPEDEVCLRCKYSEYDLSVFCEIFEKKEKTKDKTERENLKNLLNFTIGTFDFLLFEKDKKNIKNKSKYDYFGHIRAVILARHNHKMIEYYKEMRKKGYQLLCIQTDSMVWRGGPLDCVVDTSNLGDFHREISNGRVWFHGCGAYFIEDSESWILKHQGIKEFPAIDNLGDFVEYFKDNDFFIEYVEYDPDTEKHIKRSYKV